MYKELLRNQVTDTQFQIECLSDELVEMLMRRYLLRFMEFFKF